MRHAGSQLSRPVHRWACALAPLATGSLLSTGCNAIFDIQEGTRRPVCADVFTIDDLEDGDGSICKTGGRDGEWWVFGDGTAAGELHPRSDVPFEPTLIEEGARGTSRYAARFSGSGFNAWGAVMGLNLTTAPSYDLSGLGAGITFWMRSITPVHVEISSLETIPIFEGGDCAETQACNSHFTFSITAPSPDWVEYEVPFNSLRQIFGGSAIWDPRHLVNVQFNVPPGGAFDVSIDDLRFYDCANSECQPTCTDRLWPVSCRQMEGRLSSCQPSGVDCAAALDLAR